MRLGVLDGGADGPAALAGAHPVPAGAVVAATTMRALDVPSVRICPCTLREGAILRRPDSLGGA